MRRFLFKNLHPVSILIFFIATLIICFTADIRALAVIFVFLFIYALLQRKAKTILWCLPLAGFMLILNPIFYHGGETVLFSFHRINFTLEAIQNGFYCALLIICTTLIFTVLGNILTEQKFLYIFGKAFPKIALMVSMIFKHFDILSESYRQCKNMAKINGIYENDNSLMQKIKTAAVIFEAFTGAALEGSIDTALTLSAKGYYNKNKTKRHLYRIHAADVVFTVFTVLLCGSCFIPSPYALIAVGTLFLLPCLLDERRKEE